MRRIVMSLVVLVLSTSAAAQTKVTPTALTDLEKKSAWIVLGLMSRDHKLTTPDSFPPEVVEFNKKAEDRLMWGLEALIGRLMYDPNGLSITLAQDSKLLFDIEEKVKRWSSSAKYEDSDWTGTALPKGSRVRLRDIGGYPEEPGGPYIIWGRIEL